MFGTNDIVNFCGTLQCRSNLANTLPFFFGSLGREKGRHVVNYACTSFALPLLATVVLPSE